MLTTHLRPMPRTDRPVPSRARWPIALMIGLACGGSAAAGSTPKPLPRFALNASTTLDCDTTPFGTHAPMAQDVEALHLIATPSLDAIDEYRPAAAGETPPFTQVFRNTQPAALAGDKLQRAVAVDLNGDGRDELVAAYRMANGNLRLAVYQRGQPAAANLIDTWSLAQPFTQVELLAGDFSGSTGSVQQLALLVRTTTHQAQVYVLQGDANGGIAQADGASAGFWKRPGTVGSSVGFAAGDLLLDGRDQIAVVSEVGHGQARQLVYDILEFQSTAPALPVATGNAAIGSKSIATTIGTYLDPVGVENILKIEADAGDLVDTAAAELVLHVQLQESSYDYIVQRLVHFTTSRDSNGAIVDIDLYRRSQSQEFDASWLVQQQNENGRASFEAVIANIDATPKAELILARSEPSNRLLVQAWHPGVDRAAGFKFQTTGRSLALVNTSTGDATQYDWNFGDNSGISHAVAPNHLYALDGNYTVSLTAHYPGNVTRSYSTTVTVNASAHSGGIDSVWRYNLGDPIYQAQYDVESFQDLSFVNVAAGDMNGDGVGDVVTVSRNTSDKVLRSRWRLANPADPQSFFGSHALETNNAFNSMSAMDLATPDFDGDSLHGRLGNQCVQVFEPQMRQVIWLPPYFAATQAGADKQSSWGQSVTGTTSSETRSGSYTANDVSGYVGIEVGTPESLPFTIQASVSVTAGHNWQSAKGAIHGSETSLTVDQGQQQTHGEALAIYEETAFDCYKYDVSRAAGGLDPNSSMRMCAKVDGSRILTGSDAQEWDTAVPAAGMQQLNHKPAQWIPLNRDWSSLSLFRPVTTNVALGNTGAAAVTDGKFSSEARAPAAQSQPYVEIDLGQVRSIANIRVFPSAGDAIDLQGFRVYASNTPMNTNGLPSGVGITTYVPETGDAVSYDRWNIWTRSPTSPGTMLQARYIRLQHPGSAALRVAEIQVFGDLHVDPPGYPQAVCDPVANDGWFRALVWNRTAARFADIEVRGDLLWNGSGIWPTPGVNDNWVACTNYGNLPTRDIWADIAVGASATNSWNLSDSSGSLTGNVTSFDSSTRVGAQFDFSAGFIAKVTAGAAYEFTSGITQETQNTSYWSSGLDMGGLIGGFDDSALAQACRYRPRPYAYRLQDRSDTGYLHDMYQVDYVVQEGPTGLWKRASVPAQCAGLGNDRIFDNGFE